MLRMPGSDGVDVTAKFDGAFGSEMIDRKLSLPNFADKRDHARRQAGTAAYYGLTAVYEFPTQEAADNARKLLNSWGVTTIITRQAN